MTATPSRRPARICMPTTRTFSRKVFECGLYEAEDVLCAVDDVDLIGLEAAPNFRSRERWLDRFVFRDVSHRLHRMNPGLIPTRLSRDYDLFVTFTPSYEELLYINAIEYWKDRCKTSVCWIDEIWTASLDKYRHWLPVFSQFDHVCVTHHQTASALAQALGRPVIWVPAAVDALRFTPFVTDVAPERGIDAYSIGRRRPGIHTALSGLSKSTPFFYVHDTYRASTAEVYDHAAHRDLFANTAKRSRYFVVAPPKFDSVNETAGQVEVGYRYYEGAAAGSVLIGETADAEAFTQLFPWEDVVVPLVPDGTDTVCVLRQLASEPERVAAISRRNAAHSLLRHDWSYRWRTIIELAGLTASEATLDRAVRLTERAMVAGDGVIDTDACLGRDGSYALDAGRSAAIVEQSAHAGASHPRGGRMHG